MKRIELYRKNTTGMYLRTAGDGNQRKASDLIETDERLSKTIYDALDCVERCHCVGLELQRCFSIFRVHMRGLKTRLERMIELPQLSGDMFRDRPMVVATASCGPLDLPCNQ